MIREEDLVYRTPPGMTDEHFIYAYDAGALGLTPGLDYLDQHVIIDQGSDFLLRKIDGSGTLLGDFVGPPMGSLWIEDAQKAKVSDQPIHFPLTPLLGTAPNESTAVIPERRYPSGSEITFDIRGYVPWLFGQSGCGPNLIVAAQLLFYGVKRYPGTRGVKTPYPYRLNPFTYRLIVPFTWGLTQIAPGVYLDPLSPTRFYVPIRSHDFELWGIRSIDVSAVSLLPTPRARWTLYDADGNARSNIPVLGNLASYENGDQTGVVYLETAGSAIVPPILYPVGAQIQIDLWSMYFTTDPNFPYTVEFNFFGAERIPL